MSTRFQPLEIPPGVVAQATSRMRSSNWSAANLVRWVEGKLQPVGGQTRYNYPAFASRCKAIHGWYDLNSAYHVAYVCEQHVYVDTAGVLTEITPAGGWASPAPVGAGGYGDLLYGDDLYGTPRASTNVLPIDVMPPMWSVDNFGALLLVMSSIDQRLMFWDPAAGGLLVRVPATAGGSGGKSPRGRCFVVTQERFVMIFGMTQDGSAGGGDFRRFGWCDQEDMENWDFLSVTNQAGFLDIEPASPIVTAISGKFGVLMWTAKKAYLIQFAGLPYIYSYHEQADACTPWSPASMTTTSTYVHWHSEQGSWSFDGSTITPVPCAVRSWIVNDIDPVAVRSQACAVHVANFNEFWWFFPQNGQAYNTRCIIYNYKEGWWSMGQMSRSAGITSSYTVQTVMADGTVAFQHEIGNAYANADLPWAESFDLNLASGGLLTTVKQLIPDIEGDAGEVLFSLFFRMSRSLGDAEQQSARVAIRPDGYVDFRTTGRDIRLKVEVSGPLVQPFTLGQHLIDSVPRGAR